MQAIETVLAADDHDFYLLDNSGAKAREYETWLLLITLLPRGTCFEGKLGS